jgi:hypothetical protein
MNWYKNLIKRRNKNNINSIYVEEEDKITDEIEKSLWEIKHNLDLPTEEIECAILSRQNLKNKNSNG